MLSSEIYIIHKLNSSQSLKCSRYELAALIKDTDNYEWEEIIQREVFTKKVDLRIPSYLENQTQKLLVMLLPEVCGVEPSGQVKMVKNFLFVEILPKYSELVCKVIKSEGFIPRTFGMQKPHISITFNFEERSIPISKLIMAIEKYRNHIIDFVFTHIEFRKSTTKGWSKIIISASIESKIIDEIRQQYLNLKPFAS